MSATYETGTLLTCEHEHCGCRVLIQEQCNCDGADNSNYTCACGAKLIPGRRHAANMFNGRGHRRHYGGSRVDDLMFRILGRKHGNLHAP